MRRKQTSEIGPAEKSEVFSSRRESLSCYANRLHSGSRQVSFRRSNSTADVSTHAHSLPEFLDASTDVSESPFVVIVCKRAPHVGCVTHDCPMSSSDLSVVVDTIDNDYDDGDAGREGGVSFTEVKEWPLSER